MNRQPQRRLAVGFFCAWVGAAAAPLPAAAEAGVGQGGAAKRRALVTTPAEAQRKSARFLHGFAVFTTWPDSAFAGSGAPFVVGLIGDDPFGPKLEEWATRKTVHARPVRIVRARGLEDLKSCHMVYIGTGEELDQKALLRGLKKLPVLTVGDAPEFLANGGMIRLYRTGTRLAFDLNLPPAKADGLRLSAKLIRQADRVVRRRDEGARPGPGGGKT